MPVWDTVKSDSGRSQIGFYYVPFHIFFTFYAFVSFFAITLDSALMPTTRISRMTAVAYA